MPHEGLKQTQFPQDFYVRLGVSRAANEQDIKDAFRALSKIYHPEAQGGGDEEKFKALSEAYSTLKNPEKRRIYDLRTPGASQRPQQSSGAEDVRSQYGRSSASEPDFTTYASRKSNTTSEARQREKERQESERLRRILKEAEERKRRFERETAERAQRVEREIQRRRKEVERRMAERAKQLEAALQRNKREMEERKRRLETEMARRKRESDGRLRDFFKKR